LQIIQLLNEVITFENNQVYELRFSNFRLYFYILIIIISLLKHHRDKNFQKGIQAENNHILEFNPIGSA